MLAQRLPGLAMARTEGIRFGWLLATALLLAQILLAHVVDFVWLPTDKVRNVSLPTACLLCAAWVADAIISLCFDCSEARVLFAILQALAYKWLVTCDLTTYPIRFVFTLVLGGADAFDIRQLPARTEGDAPGLIDGRSIWFSLAIFGPAVDWSKVVPHVVLPELDMDGGLGHPTCGGGEGAILCLFLLLLLAGLLKLFVWLLSFVWPVAKFILEVLIDILETPFRALYQAIVPLMLIESGAFLMTLLALNLRPSQRIASVDTNGLTSETGGHPELSSSEAGGHPGEPPEQTSMV